MLQSDLDCAWCCCVSLNTKAFLEWFDHDVCSKYNDMNCWGTGVIDVVLDVVMKQHSH